MEFGAAFFPLVFAVQARVRVRCRRRMHQSGRANVVLFCAVAGSFLSGARGNCRLDTNNQSLAEPCRMDYDVSSRRLSPSGSFWKKRLIAIAATLVTAVFFLLSFALTTIGRTAAVFLANQYAPFSISKLPWDIVRWVANLLLILIAINLINYFLPNVKQRWHWITIGRSFVTLAFFLASVGFDFYITHASNIPKIYGTLAGFIIFMIWIYIASFILLVGAETDRAVKELTNAGASA